VSRERPSIAEVRRVAQPESVLRRPTEEHWAGRAYVRRVSPYVTRWCIGWGMSADGVTLLMLVTGVAAAGLLVVGGLWPALAAAVGIQLYLLLDCVDGEVARWRGTEGARGVYLDRISHYLVEGLLAAGLGWRAGAGGVRGTWLAIGLAAALAMILGRAETDLVDAARAKAGMPALKDPEPTRSGAVGRLRRLFDFVPIHRVTGAIEASLLIAAAAVVDEVRHDLVASRVLVIGLAAIAGAVAIAHLVSVMLSDRFR
jgi:phosphatidylglycerophosphate synthase